MAQLSPLRRRMIEDMTVRNMSPATQRSYVSAVSKFSRYFGKSPSSWIWKTFALFRSISSRRASHGLVSTRSSAPYASSTASRSARRTFPSVSPMRGAAQTAGCVERRRGGVFLESVSSLKSRAALTTAYAAGLRASEVAGLRVADIDSTRGVILVRHGKGAKDRT